MLLQLYQSPPAPTTTALTKIIQRRRIDPGSMLMWLNLLYDSATEVGGISNQASHVSVTQYLNTLSMSVIPLSCSFDQ